MRILLLCLALLAAWMPAVAAAQIAPADADNPRLTAEGRPDYGAWEEVVDRTQAVLDVNQADEETLEGIRAELAAWRSVFEAARTINAPRIASLTAQLDALGEAPAEDAPPEPEETAALRADLLERLAEARAPAIRAEAAHEQAEGLIDEIDSVLLARTSDTLFESGPSPLDPSQWPNAVAAVTSWATAVIIETTDLVGSEAAWNRFVENAPIALLFLLGGLVLVVRGWRVVDTMMERFAAVEATSPRARLALFALSLIRAAIPALGVLAVARGLQISGYTGPRGEVLIGALGGAVVVAVAGYWIARQVFPWRESAHHPLALGKADRRRGRRAVFVGALNIAAASLLTTVATDEGWSDATRVTVLFPLVAINALLLTRIGRLILRHAHPPGSPTEADPGAEPEEAAAPSRRAQGLGLLGRGVILIGYLGLALAAAGYWNAASTFLGPSVVSLALIALIGILQRLVTDLYGTFTGRREALDEALLPTLIGFLLAIASLPVFALIWGVRPAQLYDLWIDFLAGFELGGVTISPANFLTFVVVFAGLYTAVRLLQGALRTSVLPKTSMEAGAQTALLAGIGYVGVFLAAFIAITAAGIDLSNLAIVAGALSVGIGFGLQTIVSNFVSGVILLIERPVKEGDWIEVNGVTGYVRDISVRSTRIETFDRTDVMVPNQDLIAGTVTNYTHMNNVGRLIVPVGVAYGSDTRAVERILRDIAESHPMVLLKPAPLILFTGFGASSLDFEIRVILRDVNFTLGVKNELNHRIAERFAAEGIEIPFPQTDLWLRNPETLARPAARPNDTHAADDPWLAGDA